MKKNKISLGNEVTFYPVGGALYTAHGIITGFSKEKSTGQRLVSIKVTEGTGAGKAWFVYPSDII